MESIRSYLVFDFETSGLYPETDRIIQVGLCIVSDGEVVGQDGWLVNQDTRIHPEAAAVHRITVGDLKARGIPPLDSLTKLLKAMGEAPACVGHNIHRFDIPFLLAECRRLGVAPPDCTDFIDTAALFKGWRLGMPRKPMETSKAYAHRVLSKRAAGLKYSIPACVRQLGIQASTPPVHEAGHDAYLTHLIFQSLQTMVSAASGDGRIHRRR